MPLNICVFEDDRCRQFFPITLLRPVFSLRAGILPGYQRILRTFGSAGFCFSVRDQLSALTAERLADYPVNIVKFGDEGILFVNGRLRSLGDLPDLVKSARVSSRFENDGQTVAVLFRPEQLADFPTVATPSDYRQRYIEQHANFGSSHTTASLYNYIWDLVADIEKQVDRDFHLLQPPTIGDTSAVVHEGAYLINLDHISLGDRVEVMPGAVIDATDGPVCIGKGTTVQSHATIYGPCFIGRDCVVLEGKVSGSSIGHTCRVGGEVEESIFQSYVNKYHAGFIGHSYVGSWVNFGAMTTNSDLKNNYSNIRVSLGGETLDTGSIKVGSFVGDHTKFGIGTLLNTGINIGPCCNIFGGNLVTDKEVPPFQWGGTGNYVAYKIDKAIETAQRTSQRRGHTLSEREIAVLTAISEDRIDDDGSLCFDVTS